MTRERLPGRRLSETVALQCNGFAYVATFSRFPDGRLAEVFLSNHKTGSTLDAMAKDSAIIASLALQFGCPIETIRHALQRDESDEPISPIGAALDVIEGGAS